MLRKSCFLLIALAFAIPAQASIVISLGPHAETTNANVAAAPNQTLDFYISSDASDTLFLFLYAAEFAIEGVNLRASTDGATEPAPGVAGVDGYFGFGNLFSSSFTRGADAANATVDVRLAQQFSDMAQPVSVNPEQWFSLDLDTTGLAPGVYDIALTGGASETFLNALTGPVSVVNQNFSFTVSAVPEPSSLIAVALIGGGAIGVRRFRKRQVA